MPVERMPWPWEGQLSRCGEGHREDRRLHTHIKRRKIFHEEKLVARPTLCVLFNLRALGETQIPL